MSMGKTSRAAQAHPAPDEFLEMGRRTLRIERKALETLEQALDENFARACELLFECSGRVVVTGMGKSGHVGRKIAATLASTGTPALFVHAAEAAHGDLGMITRQDVVMALSYSGNTAEVNAMVPLLQRMRTPLIALTGKPDSPLASAADVHLNVAVPEEACPMNLAPTASTTATMAMGDALAIALLTAHGFSAEDFALSHPGGTLGRRLLLRVADLMRRAPQIPQVGATTPLREALFEISAKGLGMAVVLDEQGSLLGVFTDGDLRRALDRGHSLKTPIAEIMTRTGIHCTEQLLAVRALSLMEDHKITVLVVVDEEQRVMGVLHLHELLRAGLG